MPLGLLLGLVVGGIAGVALLLHLLGLSRSYILMGEADARHHWARFFPEDEVMTVRVASNGKAALILTQSGTGLVRSFGADVVAHPVARVETAAKGLKFSFDDFGAPADIVVLRTDEVPQWQAVLKGRMNG